MWLSDNDYQYHLVDERSGFSSVTEERLHNAQRMSIIQ